VRDRDIRNAIHDALVATQAFDGVWIWGLPEDYGSGASQLAAAAIEPDSSTQEDRWDAPALGELIVTTTVTITLLARNDDPQLRDEAVELLLDTAANALNGQNFAAFNAVDGTPITMPGLTRFRSWKWLPAAAPERRIRSTFSYAYLVEGWNALDVNQ